MMCILQIIAVITSILLPSVSYQGGQNPFDQIRPIANEGLEILKQNGDSVKAMSLLTEAIVRGQDLAETEEDVKLMGTAVYQTALLRNKYKNESFQRLMLELMVGSQVAIVNKTENAFGGHPGKLPNIANSPNGIHSDSIAKAIRHAIDLMAENRLKECEKLLITLYNYTWTQDLNPEWRNEVANKLGLLYLKLNTPESAIEVLRQNKIDMDLKMDSNPDESYSETLFYLALAHRSNNTKIIWKCFLETANEMGMRYNHNLQPIIDDFSRIFTTSQNDAHKENEVERFILANDKALSFLTDKQREKRWDNLKDRWLDIKYELIDSTGRVSDINACLNAFQYEKQIMLRSAVKTMDALRKNGDEEAIALTDSLMKTRKKWISCIVREDDILSEYEQIQKELMHHHTMYDFENHLFKILTTDSLANKLEDNDTFIDFGTLEEEDGDRYYAIVISKDNPKGQILPLCRVYELEEFMENTHDEEARRMVEKRYGNDFLYEKLWLPIIEEGNLKQRIYYCPAGSLCLIMPDAICHDGRYLGEDFEFHILSSAESLGDAKAGESYIPQRLYSFCAIDYYCERLALIANANMYGANYHAMPGSLERDSNLRTAFSDSTSIPPLHNPEDFDWLISLCEENDVPVFVPTGFNASEPALKFLSGRNVGTLNIVTHAFSMPKTLRPFEKSYFCTLHVKHKFNDKMEIEYLPLFRTGIMLSGAERAWCQRNVISGIEDGVVNGEELASLDFSGVDLLTLIACDTGNGDIDPDEGILGLRRALKLAGCKTIITTAWNLDKEAGDAYLKEFYANLLQGRGISAAHRNAQFELIKRFDNPYYWGVFQLID